VLVRSWNLFHGNTVPPQREGFLDEMVRLATVDDPDVLCLQEVPAWALGRFTAGDVAARPAIGPLPIPAELGRRLTALNPGLLRSAFAGQGNATLLGEGLRTTAHDVVTLNSPEFRRAEAQRLGLDTLARLAWAKERRICQAVRAFRDGGPPLVIANLHTTSSPGDPRIPEAELRRAAAWVDSFAGEGDVIVLGGDFNVEPHSGATLPGYSDPGPAGIDHVLVRGAQPSPLRAWPDERRTRDGILFSDHTPIELEIP